MTHSSLIRPTLALLTVVAIAACHNAPASTTPSTTSTSTTATTATTTTSSANAMPAGVTAATIAMGDSIFHARGCRNCHGANAKGARNGPDLTSGHFIHVDGTLEGFEKIITSGVPATEIRDPSHTIPMPPRGGRPTPLTDDQIKAVASYVWSLNHQ